MFTRRKFLYYVFGAGILAVISYIVSKFVRGGKENIMEGAKGQVRPEDLAMCGIDCKDCDVYQYTVNGKTDNYDKMIKGWTEHARKYWRVDNIDPEQIRCKGCRYEGKEEFFAGKHPKYCPHRNCVVKRGLTSCAHCPELQTCKTAYPEGRANLERLGLVKYQ